MKKTLTISIPVYNNHEDLCSQLKLLENQLNDDVALFVLDNNSSPSIEEYLNLYYNSILNKLTIVKNPYNVGADGNILKCFQNCSTEWLWVLSVNDGIRDNAVEIVLAEIQRNINAVFINFVANSPRIETNGFNEFCEKLPSYPRSFFISICLYNTRHLRPFYPIYSEFVSSNNGQLLVVLKCLEKNEPMGKCIFVNRDILSFETPALWKRSVFIQKSLLLFSAFNGTQKEYFHKTIGHQMVNLFFYYTCTARLSDEINFREHLRIFLQVIIFCKVEFLFKYSTLKVVLMNLAILSSKKTYKLYYKFFRKNK